MPDAALINGQLAAYLRQRKLAKGVAESDFPPLFATTESVPSAYNNLGTHPDVVERLWEQLAASIPAACKTIFLGTPALAHPESLAVFALGFGTRYILRLPGGLAKEAVRAGLRPDANCRIGRKVDLQRDLGPDWVFGAWKKEELAWCAQACKLLAPLAQPPTIRSQP